MASHGLLDSLLRAHLDEVSKVPLEREEQEWEVPFLVAVHLPESGSNLRLALLAELVEIDVPPRLPPHASCVLL